MSTLATRSRARLGALLMCCAILPQLSGCAIYNHIFHRNRPYGCSEKGFAQNTSTRPPLKVPEGMSAPDTRNAVKIATLDTPERVRAKTEPCLAQPPSFAIGAAPGTALPADKPAPVPPPVAAPAVSDTPSAK